MSGAHAQESDPVGEILGQAIWVYAALGIAQALVAGLAHKVALGADGGHNLLEFLILGGQKWGHVNEKNPAVNFRNCRIAPRSTEVTCYGTIGAAAIFFWLSLGHQSRGSSWVALALVTLSMAINIHYARRLHGHKESGANGLAAWSHLVGDSIASGLAATAYVVIGFGGPLRADPILALCGVAAIVIVHIRPIRKGRRKARAHRVKGHTHPVVIEGEEEGHHGSGHPH